MLSQGFFQVVDELLHLLLGVSREILLDIELANGLAQQGVGHVKRVFPARHLHLLARHGTAVHVKIGVGKRITQVRRSGINILEDQVFLDVVGIERLHHLVDLGERFGLEHAHLVQVIDVQGCEILAPVDIGIVGTQLIKADHIVEFAVVAGLLACHCHTGKSCLDVHHALSGLLGVGLLVTDELEQLLDVVVIGIAHLDRVGVVVQIIVTVTHAQTSLHQVEHIGVRVLQVGHDSRVEEG